MQNLLISESRASPSLRPFAQSLDAHSGFDLPFPLSPWSAIKSMDCAPAHDFHHSHNVGNYGGYFIFWDWAMGTDRAYRAHVQKKAVGKKAS